MLTILVRYTYVKKNFKKQHTPKYLDDVIQLITDVDVDSTINQAQCAITSDGH